MLLLEGFLARDPHQLAVRDAAGDHDWGAVLAQARRVAGTLAAVGPPGMAVGLMVEPGVRWLASLLGIWHAGGVAVPLSPLHPPREIAWLLEDAEAACLLTDHDVAPSGVPHLDPRACEGPEADTPRGHSLAMLLYTSGTTGRPKGVELEHAALTHQADELGEVWRLGELRNLLHALPLHHMHGIAIAGLPCLRAGMALTMHPRFRAPTIWEGLAEVDTFMGVPTMYHRLLEAFDAADAATRARWQAAARRVALFTSGSAALPASLATRWEALAGAIPLERYGMTEIGVGCSNPRDAAGRRRGWVGPPLPSLETRIMGEDGAPAEPGPGSLEVRGPGVFHRYHRRPEATREAFGDGWFVTGDV
ncbi:MAG: AMP-binding protein, partial [Myxococcales bacterium]|nr:AMP-binding protein [Myxococcales bacterium]